MEEPLVKMPPVPVSRKHMEGNVEFKDVSYTADDEDIVKDISFSVKKGQTVGILGSTGAGKSTIMNLLCRFVDATSGEVLVDGVNVKDWNLYDLRDNILIQLKGILHTVVRTVHLRKFTKLLSWQMPTISSRLCPKL